MWLLQIYILGFEDNTHPCTGTVCKGLSQELMFWQVAAWGHTVPAVLAARVCVGLGEGAALPVMNNLVATNISPKKRATALGSCFSGFHTGKLRSSALRGLKAYVTLPVCLGILHKELSAWKQSHMAFAAGKLHSTLQRKVAVLKLSLAVWVRIPHCHGVPFARTSAFRNSNTFLWKPLIEVC